MFIGRKDILADLETLWRKRSSSIIACRGRGLSTRPVLVYDGELDGGVEGAGFFDAIIPAQKLLEN